MGLADDGPVVRLTTFHPVEVWNDVDRELRALVPIFATQPGLLDVWVGRRGAGSGDDRVAVSMWSSARSQDAAITVPQALARDARAGTAIEDARIEVLPIRIMEQFPSERPMLILRIFRGTCRPGELESYLSEARTGVLIDGSRPDGPGALVSAVDGAGGFVTASLWPDWASIEVATGGDVDHPLATRNSARLASGGPIHFELVATLGDLT